MNILELFAHIGLKADQAPADRFLGAVNGIKKDIIGAIAGTLSLAGAIKAVNAAMGDALELKKFSDATGSSTDSMQRWRAVADQVSGSGAAVSDSIKAITSNQDKIKLGSGNISGYQLLGIDPRNDPYEVLKQIRDKTAKLEPGMRRNIIGMFGVSTDLISTFKLTNAQFDKMAARAYVISPAMIDGMNRARASMETVKNAMLYFTADLATKLGPAIEKVSAWLIRFVQFVERGVLMIDKMVRGTIGWKTAIFGIVAVLGVLNAGFLLSPIGLFTMAMLALMAVLYDFSFYAQGKASVIGVFMKKFPALGEIINGAFGFIGDAIKAIKDFFGGDQTAFNNFVDKWGALGLVIKMIAEQIKNVKDIFDALLKGDWDTVFKKMGPLGAIISALAGGAEGMKKWEGQLKDSGAKLMESLGAAYKGVSGGLDSLLHPLSIPKGAQALGTLAPVLNVHFLINGVDKVDEKLARKASGMIAKAWNDSVRSKTEK